MANVDMLLGGREGDKKRTKHKKGKQDVQIPGKHPGEERNMLSRKVCGSALRLSLEEVGQVLSVCANVSSLW